MNPNEQQPNNDNNINNAPLSPDEPQQTVADLAQSPEIAPTEQSAAVKPEEVPRPPAVQPSADGAIIAPIGDELFHEPSLVKPKDNKMLIIIIVAAGVVLIGGGILIFWLLTKK
jgi:hypothetical protein